MDITLSSISQHKDIKKKPEIINTVNHILRTPITCIFGVSHLLKTTSLTTEQADYLHNEESTHHLLAAIDF